MSENLFTFALSVFTGFFAIMNPIANTPIFLGMVDGESEDDKRKIAKTATLTAFIIVLAFVILGKFIFELFGLTIPAFKITGGILIFFVGFEMLQSRKSKIHGPKEQDFDDSVAISPLAIPILAGPGTIVTAMNYVTNADYVKILIVILIFGLMVFITYLTFSAAEKIVKKVGKNFIEVIGKLMGLILAIIGTGMVINGIKLAF
ncbi:MarC family protein [Echinicola shivajiensis]|uniref:MarC family protein n=1 Tax=Echinicola shivajiensis TaxID=1035916 RepID=UPI001BFCC0A7|nr:MarC family protein [Echinicola shivajiensis]